MYPVISDEVTALLWFLVLKGNNVYVAEPGGVLDRPVYKITQLGMDTAGPCWL